MAYLYSNIYWYVKVTFMRQVHIITKFFYTSSCEKHLPPSMNSMHNGVQCNVTLPAGTQV